MKTEMGGRDGGRRGAQQGVNRCILTADLHGRTAEASTTLESKLCSNFKKIRTNKDHLASKQ